MANGTYLLSTVGISEYEPTSYVLDGQQVKEARLAPEALIQLLDLDGVLLAYTETVAMETDYREQVQQDCREHELDYESVEVPLVSDQSDIDEILDTLVGALDDLEPESVVLDVSHAFRSLQLAFYTSVVQLVALELIELEAIYYAEDAGGGENSQIIDLTYLYTLMEWYHALRSFSTGGTLKPLQTVVESRRNRIYRQGGEDPDLVDLQKGLASVGSLLDSGLPLEAGIASRSATKTLAKFDDSDFIGPEGTFIDPLADQLQELTVNQPNVQTKTEIDLTIEELKRERDVIRFYLEHDKYTFALECARELYINCVLYVEYGPDVDWLDKDIRHVVQRAINEQARNYRDNDESPPEPIRLWDSLSQYRNAHAHAGFDPKQTQTGEPVENVVQQLCSNVTVKEFWEPVGSFE